MTSLILFAIAAGATFVGLFILVPILLGFAQMLGLYTIVEERRCRVYVLFGKVLGVLDEPGLPLPAAASWACAALVVNLLGRCYVLDMRLDQEYLRSQPVNSEEGAPMGIGIWYEMFISDPVSYLFKNADPRGSLAANVGNATVRCLSQPEARRHAGQPPHHEPDGARRGLAQVAGVGLQARLGLHPQGALPRRRHDQAASRRRS